MATKVIEVKASAGARKERLEEVGPDSFKVWVSVSPEKGKANERIRELLAKHLGVAKSKVALKSGAASRQKLFSVELP